MLLTVRARNTRSADTTCDGWDMAEVVNPRTGADGRSCTRTGACASA